MVRLGSGDCSFCHNFIRDRLIVLTVSSNANNLEGAYEQRFQSRIAKPVFSVMAYSLIWMTFKQFIMFKFVVLTNPFLRDYLEIIFNLVYVVLVFAVLFKVMNDSQKELNSKKEKARVEFEAFKARMEAKERDL